VGDLFRTIQDLKAEKEDPQGKSPLTKEALNQVRDFQSHVQDGRGGNKPSNPQAVNREIGKEYSTGIRDPPGWRGSEWVGDDMAFFW
jgi:hypothetical protein